MAPTKEEPKKKLSPKEEAERKKQEALLRHEAALKSRKNWHEKQTKRGKRLIALSLLEKQLEGGTRPVKGDKPFKGLDGSLLWGSGIPEIYSEGIEWEVLKDGSKKPIRISEIPLDVTDKIRIEHQISSLRKKLHITI